MIYLTDYRTASTIETTFLEDIAYPQHVHMLKDTYKRIETGLAYPPHKLADKVLDPALLEDLRNRPGKTAFIFASGNSHLAGINGKQKQSQLTYDYKMLPLTLTQIYAGRIAQLCGAQDLVTTDASACASSLKVLMDVMALTKLHRFDRVVVLSFEDPITNNVLQFFGEAGASLTEKSTVIPSAFDSHNYGFYVGQGAVLAVFETADGLTKKPEASLWNAFSASEISTNAIGQREDGQGFVRAIEGALQGITESKVEVVKTHGTGTKSNNVAEHNALQECFGNNYVATSFKPTIGHTMGASGLLETCLLLDSIKETGKIPAIKNRTEHDSVYLSEDVDYKGGLILSLAAGMGNIYSAAIFDTRVR